MLVNPLVSGQRKVEYASWVSSFCCPHFITLIIAHHYGGV